MRWRRAREALWARGWHVGRNLKKVCRSLTGIWKGKAALLGGGNRGTRAKTDLGKHGSWPVSLWTGVLPALHLTPVSRQTCRETTLNVPRLAGICRTSSEWAWWKRASWDLRAWACGLTRGRGQEEPESRLCPESQEMDAEDRSPEEVIQRHERRPTGQQEACLPEPQIKAHETLILSC